MWRRFTLQSARIALFALLLSNGIALLACEEARCPSETLEVRGHCVVQADSANAAAAGIAASAQGAGAVASAPPAAHPAENTAGATSTASSAAVAGMRSESGNAAPAPVLANGESCASARECASGFCTNISNGRGVCCDSGSDCCKSESDCAGSYNGGAQCSDPENCRGTAKGVRYQRSLHASAGSDEVRRREWRVVMPKNPRLDSC
jgi:hypothetical protein